MQPGGLRRQDYERWDMGHGARGQAMHVTNLRAGGALAGADGMATCSGAGQLAMEGRWQHGGPGRKTEHRAQ